VPKTGRPSSDPNRIFLIDTMSFIFRAYHAMARQRSMSTKSGLPTAAIYVFVNMLRKLREDFSPAYLAAVPRYPGRSHYHGPQVRHQNPNLH
jgi:DNA polymerase-1